MKKNILIILLFISQICLTVNAKNIYGGLGYSYNVLSTENDFWNGGDGNAPYFTVGSQISRFSVELSYRSVDLKNLHTTTLGTYDITVHDKLLNLGLKLDLNRFTHVNFGVVLHSVEATYSTTSVATLNTSSITGNSAHAYIGGGVHGLLFLNNLKYSIDVNYYHRTGEFGVFSIDTGIFYSFYNF